MMSSLFDLNSDDSDSDNDCDYIPPAGEISEQSDNNESFEDDEIVSDGVKKIKGKKRKRKQMIVNEVKSDQDEGKSDVTPEEEKKKADELWKQFQMDVKPISKPQISTPLVTDNSKSKELDEAKLKTNTITKDSKVTITEIFDFAGEEVKVTKNVDAKTVIENKFTTAHSSTTEKPTVASVTSPSNGVPKRPVSGLSAALGALAKKPKLSTLQKSLYDWNNFKETEGIEEDLKIHNKGKGGFLEKQAFLQRSDLRQFEIEKNIRSVSRRTNL